MEKNFKRTLVTTALPYANGPVHIGHLAGVYVPADIYTRYLRLKGEDVIMIGGSDEHGVPITIKGNLSRKPRCNITTRRLTSSSQTGILPGLVRTVATNMPMATNARLAAHR